MDSVHQISQAINSNDIDCGIACGAEDMFGVPMGGLAQAFILNYMKKNFICKWGNRRKFI